ncbi:MAG TPA: peptide chain release factor N(5)-glutamine methyltransferase, partial [Burkholderiales bacterium]
DAAEARLLLAHALGVTRAQLVAHVERALAPADERRFTALVERRASGEPVAYIVGEREFWGLALRVSPAVLIPRPETELLVERALALLPEAAGHAILDLGTGSGALAIALARERPRARVVASDVSAEALEIARENARTHGTTMRFALGDWLAAVGPGERFEMIVSNPPYVASGDPHLALGDLRFEPRGALDGGGDGLDCIRRIARAARAHLVPGGWLLLEHGYDQAGACRELLADAGYRELQDYRDLAGHPRVCAGRRPD